MRIVLQRVTRARVEVAGETTGVIGRGLVALVGIEPLDDERSVVAAAEKVAALRLFDDHGGRMNLPLAAVGGGVLLVSQFTLLASTARGRRPSFDGAARPEIAAPLIEALGAELERRGLQVERGRFGADMQVELVNDGPVTLVLEIPPRQE